MAWERRGGRLVYYSARREGRRVVKTYYGAGVLARSAALLDGEARAEREEQRNQEWRQREDEDRIEAQASELDALIDEQIEALGLHRHKRGRWRRRRSPAASCSRGR